MSSLYGTSPVPYFIRRGEVGKGTGRRYYLKNTSKSEASKRYLAGPLPYNDMPEVAISGVGVYRAYRFGAQHCPHEVRWRFL
jgi:hypothetical protein